MLKDLEFRIFGNIDRSDACKRIHTGLGVAAITLGTIYGLASIGRPGESTAKDYLASLQPGSTLRYLPETVQISPGANRRISPGVVNNDEGGNLAYTNTTEVVQNPILYNNPKGECPDWLVYSPKPAFFGLDPRTKSGIVFTCLRADTQSFFTVLDNPTANILDLLSTAPTAVITQVETIEGQKAPVFTAKGPDNQTITLGATFSPKG